MGSGQVARIHDRRLRLPDLGPARLLLLCSERRDHRRNDQGGESGQQRLAHGSAASASWGADGAIDEGSDAIVTLLNQLDGSQRWSDRYDTGASSGAKKTAYTCGGGGEVSLLIAITNSSDTAGPTSAGQTPPSQ